MKNMKNIQSSIVNGVLVGMSLAVPNASLRAMNQESSAITVVVDQEELGAQLCNACERDDVLEVERLLSAPGIDVNKVNTYVTTPLYVASAKGHIEIVKLLLATPGIDVNKTTWRCGPSLLAASGPGHIEIVKLLLAAPGIDVNKAMSNGMTPLACASSNGRIEIVKLLLAVPGIDVNNGSPLVSASREGRIEIVKLLLAVPGIDVNKDIGCDVTSLSSASYKGHREIVKLLLAAGANPLNDDDDQVIIGFDCVQEIKKAQIAWKYGPLLCQYSDKEKAYVPNNAELNLTDENKREIADIYGALPENMNVIAHDFLAIIKNVTAGVTADRYHNCLAQKTLRVLRARKSSKRTRTSSEDDQDAMGSLHKLPKELFANISEFMVDSDRPVASPLAPFIKAKSHEAIARTITRADKNDLAQELGYKNMLQSSRMISYLEAHKPLDSKTGALIVHPTAAHAVQ